MRRILPAAVLALCLFATPAAATAATTATAVATATATTATAATATTTTTTAAATTVAAPTPSPAVPSDLTATEVSFRGSGGLAMHGTVVSPAAAKPARPGMVLVHGAGEGPREKLMGEAVEFARRGLSVLIYDKRSEGYSLFHRSYSQLADDALGAVAALAPSRASTRRRSASGGSARAAGWSLIAASRSKDIGFVVLVGANGLPPLRQQTWTVAAGLRKAGVSGSLIDRAEFNLYRAISDGGMFPEPYYDPAPVLSAVRQPVLGIWGTHDLLTPPKESPPIFAEALEKGGNRHYTFRFFPGADHAAHQTPDGGVTRLPELAPATPTWSVPGSATSRQAGRPRHRSRGPPPCRTR
ncbi:alpha/beta hydrolase family protein [Streptosporangium lutulentum]